ncbi:MAG: 50S ribosomal protein L11 methyltransferase [Firmicutes bacterium]|nr:50S ribosomal protein L11 methyltransferase [Bacillota bacterium]
MNTKKTFQFAVTTTHEAADIVAVIFDDLGSEGVRIEDSCDAKEVINSGKHWDYYDYSLTDNNPDVLVVGHLNSGKLLKKRLKQFRKESEIKTGSLKVKKSPINNNWNEEWRKFYKPIAIDKVVIVPQWITEYDKNLIPIFIEPGAAFGTGSHESTALCIKLLCGLDLKNKTVLDLGCGSGILGLTASALGAKKVDMVDFDAKAVEIARHNVILNNMTERISTKVADVTTSTIKGPQYNCIVANLTADLLISAIDTIVGSATKDSKIIIGGIISDRAATVKQVYARHFEIVREERGGDWVAYEAIFYK